MPHLSVAIGVVLAIASLAVLIYFIHHTAHSIRIETLLAVLATETCETIDRLYPDKLGHGPPARPEDRRRRRRRRALLAPTRSGYVQYVDTNALLDLATGTISWCASTSRRALS